MKMIKYLLGFLLTALLLPACNDNLDLYPPTKLSQENYWKTENDLINGVNVTYKYAFPQTGDGDTQGNLDILYFETASDNTFGQHTNQFFNFQQVALGYYESNHGAIQYLWKRSYECIRKCNEFLLNEYKVTKVDTLKRKRYISEVLFQRAYHYYYLTALWGDVPWVDQLLSIQQAGEITRTDKYIITDRIIADLDTAFIYLPSNYEKIEDDGRATKWAAAALKSRICLEMAGDYRENPDSKYWALAADAAWSVANPNECPHRLNRDESDPVKSYAQVFYDEDMSGYGKEVIYEAQFTMDERPLYGIQLKIACVSDQGWNSYVPTQDLIDAYGMRTTGKQIEEDGSGYDPTRPFDNRDPRLEAGCYYPGCTTLKGKRYDSQPGSGGSDDMNRQSNITQTGYGMKKYLDVTDTEHLGEWNYGHDIPLIRLAEIMLNFAEAENERLSDPSGNSRIRSIINQIRNRVGMPSIPNGLTKDQMREVIRRERRVELALEGNRFFDIRRWKIADEVLNKNNGWILGMQLRNPGSFTVNENGQVRAAIRVFNPNKHYLWPIPQREIELNPNLLPNNPGWN